MADEEVTSPDKRSPIEHVLDEVILTRKASEAAADAAMEAIEALRAQSGILVDLDKRVTHLELQRYWIPTAFSVAAFVVSILALMRVIEFIR